MLLLRSLPIAKHGRMQGIFYRNAAGCVQNKAHLHVREQGRQLTSKSAPVPDEADVVVVGGGIIGSSVAYHLAKLGKGKREVLLLERDQLTSGTTWHAAGLMVTFGSLSETSTEFRKYTKKLYSTILEGETGQSTGFKPCGFIELATNADRLEEFRRIATFNRYCGVEVEELSAQQVQDKFPLCNIDDVLAGFYVKDDGRVNPVDATMAFSKAARMYGATVLESCPVSRIITEPTLCPGQRRAAGVELEDGRRIRARTVVNCAGMWARQLAETAGVVCPNQAAEHYYLITDSMPNVDPNWPVIEDPASYTYIRPEGGGLMVGLFEGKGASWNVGRIPDNFSFGEIPPDWDRLEPYLAAAMRRVPASMQVGAKRLFCGPESFTPDLGPILGLTPEVDDLFLAAGMNSIGILTGGGAGRLVANWILDGRPTQDVSGVSPARFQAYQQTPKYRKERVEEMLGKVYKCHYPFDSPASCRGARYSPLYWRLKQQGAFFRDVGGYEMPDWFVSAIDGVSEPSNELTWGRPNWFQAWAAEHKACREGVVLMDMSFMSKFRVRGDGSGAMLNWLSTANVDSAVNRITYTQWLNEAGTLEADLTVIKLGADDFMVVASDNTRRHVEAWMRRHVPTDGASAISIQDVTAAYGQINVQGPLSRALLEKVVDVPLDDASFRFRDARWVEIGYSKVMCVRITYLGELGFELYMPTEQAELVYEAVTGAGAELGLRHAGLKSLASLRLEKGYRDYGHDLDNTDPILRTGLGFTCDFAKQGSFLGAEATRQHKMQLTEGRGTGPLALTLRLCNVLCLDPDVMLHHGEVLLRDGVPLGYMRAASYGHTLGGAVGIAEVGRGGSVADGAPVISGEFLRSGVWELAVGGRRYPARVQLAPLYDPRNERVRM